MQSLSRRILLRGLGSLPALTSISEVSRRATRVVPIDAVPSLAQPEVPPPPAPKWLRWLLDDLDNAATVNHALRTNVRMDPDIACLKSVSEVSKHRMMRERLWQEQSLATRMRRKVWRH